MSSDVAIKVDGVSKSFKLPHDKSDSIKSKLVSRKDRQRGYEVQEVLKDISFEVKKGEFFGIVGRNGSGKSTLLKIISQIYSPDKGEVHVNGKLTPFIELGIGFNPELTGRENVFLNGALLGFSRDEMESMYGDIVEFAELERFMDQQLKNYSSGMQVRLAFSIAIRADADILLLDEVLAVGDEAFQRKCYEYFAQLKRENKTVVLVTHSMDSVLRFCNKAMLVDKGYKTKVGSPSDIAEIYRSLNEAEKVEVKKEDNKTINKYVGMEVDLRLTGGRLFIDITVNPEQQLEDPMLSFAIYSDDGSQVYRWVSDENTTNEINLNRKFRIKIELEDVFPYGKFYASVFLKNRLRTVDYANFIKIAEFEKPRPKKSSSSDIFWKLKEKTVVENVE